MGAKRRNYDDEFKQAAIRLVRVNGHGVSETARNLGINANILSRWKHEDEAKQPPLRPVTVSPVRSNRSCVS
jgi:transposase-like protein